MALKTFKIKIDNKDELIEYEDDIQFGTMEQIIKNAVDLRDITKPRIDVAAYRFQTTLAALTKAPFNYKKPNEFKQLGRKTANAIVSGVMKDYPLVSSLEGWMTSLLGSSVENEQLTQSTATAQQDSDGQKTKQTDTE